MSYCTINRTRGKIIREQQVLFEEAIEGYVTDALTIVVFKCAVENQTFTCAFSASNRAKNQQVVLEVSAVE